MNGGHEEGTTLVEVLVAMLVFVTGLMAIAQLFLAAASANGDARGITIAATLAAQKVEELLASDLADVADRVDHVDAWGHVSGTGDVVPADAVYTRRWSIETLPVGVVAIRVRVGRTSRDRRAGTMAGETRLLTFRMRTPS